MSHNFFKNGNQSFVNKNCKIGESLFGFATQKKNSNTIDSVLASLETPYNYNNDVQFGNLASKSLKGKCKSFVQSPQKKNIFSSKNYDKPPQRQNHNKPGFFIKPNKEIPSKFEKPIDKQPNVYENHKKKYNFNSFMGSPGKGDPFCYENSKINKSMKNMDYGDVKESKNDSQSVFFSMRMIKIQV